MLHMVSITPSLNVLKTAILPDFVTFHPNLLLPSSNRIFSPSICSNIMHFLGFFGRLKVFGVDPPTLPSIPSYTHSVMVP